MQSTCPDCRGAGQTISHPCNECHGEGRVRVNKKLSINIPAGVDDGSRLRLKGEGEKGTERALSSRRSICNYTRCTA
ncbi:MAG: hypothetical protein CM1200mP16_04650 [Nitrospina sp.]|nr:MAG: hypothetical protein CM1200mP16_04650 [Nitrospina sp.]